MSFWTPEPIFTGATCFVLGSGPSLMQDVVDRLKGRRTIAVNHAYQLAPWADVLFFQDTTWGIRNRDEIAKFAGMVVTPDRAGSERSKARRIETKLLTEFPPAGSPIVRRGRSAGQTAVALALAMGAARIVLVGFDMTVDEVSGRSHFHDAYTNEASKYRWVLVPSFNGWRKAALKVGVAIVNATPDSALREFPMVTLDDELGEA